MGCPSVASMALAAAMCSNTHTHIGLSDHPTTGQLFVVMHSTNTHTHTHGKQSLTPETPRGGTHANCCFHPVEKRYQSYYKSLVHISKTHSQHEEGQVGHKQALQHT